MRFELDQSRTVERAGQRIYLVRVAQAQRVLLLTLLLQFGLLVAWTWLSVDLPRSVRQFVSPTCSVFLLMLGILAAVYTARLVRAAGLSAFAATVSAFATFIPFVGIFALGLINHRALSLIRTHGAHVGFLGVPGSEMVKLVEGACPSCGYDLRGLPLPTCPECGAPNPTLPPAPC